MCNQSSKLTNAIDFSTHFNSLETCHVQNYRKNIDVTIPYTRGLVLSTIISINKYTLKIDKFRINNNQKKTTKHNAHTVVFVPHSFQCIINFSDHKFGQSKSNESY